MKKSNLLKGAAAMALGLAAVGCSHEDTYNSYEALKAQIIAEYNDMFIKTFGQPASNQDWGFGTSGTRAFSLSADGQYWNGDHNCTQTTGDWTTKLNIKSQAEVEAENAIDITKNWDEWGNYSGDKGKVYYVPQGETFDFNLHYQMEFKEEGMALYNYGTITGMSQFNCGNYIVTFYNAGTIEDFWANTQRHTIINTGTLKLSDYANIGDLYNSGTLVLGGATTVTEGEYTPELGYHTWEVTKVDVPNAMHIYSTGLVAMFDEEAILDLKAVCDIHNKLYVEGDLKIQNSTSKYICNIECTGKVENVDGPLYVSNIVANDLEFDGNDMYLTQGGHIDVTNTTKIYNSACHVYAVSGSNALIETKNLIFENDNDFDLTFSDNIYFKVDGYINTTASTSEGIKHDYYANAAAYIAENGDPNGKLNAGYATGSPACGDAWTVGTPDPNDDDDDDDDNTGDDEPNWVFQARVFAEDLSVTDESDFDFNDVVFDVYYSTETSQTKVQLLAAGGTLPITVAGYDVHAQFGEGTTTMINTGVVPGYNIVNGKTAEAIILEGIVEVNDIKIVVSKSNTLLTLEATQGKPAAKFAVPAQIKWCAERSNIEDVYTQFGDWVKNPSTVWYTTEDYGNGVK